MLYPLTVCEFNIYICIFIYIFEDRNLAPCGHYIFVMLNLLLKWKIQELFD